MSAVPSTFGKYYLTEKIATGGMAEIYLAKIIGPGGFEKFLVIKKIHPELSGESQFVEMFVAEAKTLVSLSHGNIVPIYELGMVDSTYFIAMEYIDGPTLEELLVALREHQASLSPSMTAYICAELLKGLDYAHRKGSGVIHRDLSPRNVMFSREGEVKLVDFGIAVAQVGNSATRGRGDPAGSYPYMSPEQVRGDALDGRSDIFATGILLWEMLTGRRLFAAKDDKAILDAVLQAPIPKASEFCAEAAGVLDVVCARALERRIEDRYASAGDLLVAINRFLYSQHETVSPLDLSKLISKHCPPTVTSEFPAFSSTQAAGKIQRSGTVPLADGAKVRRKRSGTVPMERPQGKKRRPETVQSFATHVNLREVLSHAGTMEEAEPAALTPLPPPPALTPAPEQAPPQPQPQPRRSMWPLAGGGAVLLLGAVYFIGVSQGGAQSADTADAALSLPSDAAPTDSVEPLPLPLPPDAAPVPIDAAPVVVKRRADAQEKKALGSIRVGANPWADVYLDGKSIGRAPGNFEVESGPHKLELRFGDQTKVMRIKVNAGELTSLGVIDFTQ